MPRIHRITIVSPDFQSRYVLAWWSVSVIIVFVDGIAMGDIDVLDIGEFRYRKIEFDKPSA